MKQRPDQRGSHAAKDDDVQPRTTLHLGVWPLFHLEYWTTGNRSKAPSSAGTTHFEWNLLIGLAALWYAARASTMCIRQRFATERPCFRRLATIDGESIPSLSGILYVFGIIAVTAGRHREASRTAAFSQLWYACFHPRSGCCP